MIGANEFTNGLLISICAVFYLVPLLHLWNLMFLCCMRKKVMKLARKNKSKSKRKKTKAETVESLVDSRLQATQCEDSAHPPSHGKNRGVVSKTQDSQSPPSEEAQKEKARQKKTQTEKQTCQTEQTIPSLKQTLKLPRAPKGNHETELIEMEMILDEQSTQSRFGAQAMTGK
ncbi:hypothetical protein V3C99_013006 [Haemonchus contortus]